MDALSQAAAAAADSQSDAPAQEGQSPESSLQRMALPALGIFLFFLFLILKLPETRIQNLVVAHAKIEAQKMGYAFSTEKMTVGIILGPSVTFYGIELKSLDDDRMSLKLEKLKLKPSLFSLLPFMSVKKASFSADLLGGRAAGTVGAGATTYVVDVSVENVALDKSKLITSQIPVQIGGATIDADIDVTVDTADAKKTAGTARVKISKFLLPQQSVYGFNLPKISVAEATANVGIAEGKATIRAFDVGKDIKTDDLVAKLTGDATLDTARKYFSPLEGVKLNLAANFEISPALKASFPFLDAILAAGKQPDGKYRYRLGGTLAMPAPTPGG